ncbi:hypothetical protein DITRI_Ditri12bG0043100 [Diplodiscus trichospermus]
MPVVSCCNTRHSSAKDWDGGSESKLLHLLTSAPHSLLSPPTFSLHIYPLSKTPLTSAVNHFPCISFRQPERPSRRNNVGLGPYFCGCHSVRVANTRATVSGARAPKVDGTGILSIPVNDYAVNAAWPEDRPDLLVGYPVPSSLLSSAHLSVALTLWIHKCYLTAVYHVVCFSGEAVESRTLLK